MNGDLTALMNDLALMRPLDLHYYSNKLNDELPELAAMADCPQDPGWHAEGDVLTHTQMVIDAARTEIASDADLPRHLKQSIYLAALLHDIGKPATTYSSEYGRIISPGHSRVGLPLARAILYRLGAPFEIREQAIMLILRHMVAYRLAARMAVDLIIHGINIEQMRYRRLAAELNMAALYYLTRADWLGREGSGIDRVLAQMEKFRARSLHYQLWHRNEELIDAAALGELGINEAEQARIKHELLILSLAGQVQTRAAIDYLKDHPEMMRPTKAHLYVTIGLPGCGKSTWLAEHLAHVRAVSSDAKRVELFGDINWQGGNARVFNECYLDIERALARGQQTALDATNIKYSQRLAFLNLARRYHAHSTIIYFDLPPAVAQARNCARDRQVPAAAIARYFHDLEAPRDFEAENFIIISQPIPAIWQ